MSQRFYITGLPRSGTAWLSRFFTVGTYSYCFHEAETLVDLPRSLEEIRQRMDGLMSAAPAEVVGNASGLLLELDPREIGREFPVLLIERPIDQVRESMARLGYGMANAAHLLERMELWKQRPGTICLTYEKPFRAETMRLMWRVVMGFDLPFPEGHWLQMKRLRIEIGPMAEVYQLDQKEAA